MFATPGAARPLLLRIWPTCLPDTVAAFRGHAVFVLAAPRGCDGRGVYACVCVCVCVWWWWWWGGGLCRLPSAAVVAAAAAADDPVFCAACVRYLCAYNSIGKTGLPHYVLDGIIGKAQEAVYEKRTVIRAPGTPLGMGVVTENRTSKCNGVSTLYTGSETCFGWDPHHRSVLGSDSKTPLINK